MDMMLPGTQVLGPALRAATSRKTAPFDLRPPPVESTIYQGSAYTQPVGKYGWNARARQVFSQKSNNFPAGHFSEPPSLNDTQ
jgi:hypothetical protein